jgi:hypothetical protein
MKFTLLLTLTLSALFTLGCASPPSSDPSKVELVCAQQCNANLTTCSSGFKLFPVVAQKQCNDTYDVCIKSCPARSVDPGSSKAAPGVSDRLKALDQLLQSGAITKEEYEAKRKDILNAL